MQNIIGSVFPAMPKSTIRKRLASTPYTSGEPIQRRSSRTRYTKEACQELSHLIHLQKHGRAKLITRSTDPLRPLQFRTLRKKNDKNVPP